MIKLHHSPGSPYVRKVMICAHELGLLGRIELVPTVVSPLQANDALAPENPLMKIPSLTTDDGIALFDSPVICEYLDSLAPGNKLFPASGAARWIALRQQALGDGILDALILCRYEAAMRPEEKRWTGWIDGQMNKVRNGLGALESETIGPITAGVVLGYLDFRFPDDGWRIRHPKLRDWYNTVAELPSMTATAPPAG
jgi:glutathione S-transferase